MPPKAKPAKRVKQDAERVSHPAVEAPLPGTKKLTGILATLPLEILMEVLVRCEPSGVMRLLATSKALTNMANESETTIYRKLYHNLLVKGAVGAHVIHSPVWKKGKALISYPRSAPLPAAVVYSWKFQFASTARYEHQRAGKGLVGLFNAFVFGLHAQKSCVECGVKEENAVIVDLDALAVTLCLACYAQNLVSKSNVSIYGLTANDVNGVATVEAATVGGYGRIGSGNFYSGIALRQLALQKHGRPQELIPVAEIKREEMSDREALVATATLLHGGRIYSTRFAHEDGYGYQWLGLELNYFVRAHRFTKSKHLVPPHPKGYLNYDQIVKRPLDAILSDYAKMVREHQHDFPSTDGTPFLLPAIHRGPATPRTASVAAYKRLVTQERKGYYHHLMEKSRSIGAIKTLQRYVLSPTEVNYRFAANLLDDVQHQISRPRKAFAPLPSNANRFDATAEKKSCSAYTASLSSGRLRLAAELRIETLVQMAQIIDQPWDRTTAEKMMLSTGGFETCESGHWQRLFFQEGDVRKLLIGLYLATREENVAALIIANSSPTIPSNASLGYRLSPSAFSVFRARPLVLRAQHASACIAAVEESSLIAKKLTAGTMTNAGFVAALIRSEEAVPCHRMDTGANFCYDSCWIARLGYNDVDDDGYSDDDFF